jgi:D-alanyl-D-alanine carboxypeptidase
MPKALYLHSYIKNLILPVILITGIIALSAQPLQAKPNPKYASIVMDVDTGMILSQSNADKMLHPASLSKMMTLLLTFEALRENKIGLNDRVVMSRHAASMVPSKLGLKPGKTIKVEDAIYIIVTKSANDVAVALAEKIAGTESHFAVEMRKKARELGMSRTNFRNATGLHNYKQVSTTRDMAKLARHLMLEYPEYYHYFSTRKFKYKGQTYYNHNRLMNSYTGRNGLKTGYVRKSGFNLAASVDRDGKRIIGIVFGGRTAKSRNAHMKKLLDRGIAKLERIQYMASNVPVPRQKPDIPEGVILAAANKVNLVSPAAGYEKDRTLSVSRILEDSGFSNIIGEGDYDQEMVRKLEAGLLAIAAFQNNYRPSKNKTKVIKASYRASADVPIEEKWSIQVGAFSSRVKTNNVLEYSMKKLPEHLSKNVFPSIAPLKTRDGWLFRARLKGYSKKEAMNACSHLNNCLLVSPQAY